jgi:hypothetical protein
MLRKATQTKGAKNLDLIRLWGIFETAMQAVKPGSPNAKTHSAQHCADLTQGLAFTDCRFSEAAQIEWRDLSFEIGKSS